MRVVRARQYVVAEPCRTHSSLHRVDKIVSLSARASLRLAILVIKALTSGSCEIVGAGAEPIYTGHAAVSIAWLSSSLARRTSWPDAVVAASPLS